jgi:hypothetical protein
MYVLSKYQSLLLNSKLCDLKLFQNQFHIGVKSKITILTTGLFLYIFYIGGENERILNSNLFPYYCARS